MKSSATWQVIWSPEEVRSFAPDFDQPASKGPFLIISFTDNKQLAVFNFEQTGVVLRAYWQSIQDAAKALGVEMPPPQENADAYHMPDRTVPHAED